jgi:hypothetical protein
LLCRYGYEKWGFHEGSEEYNFQNRAFLDNPHSPTSYIMKKILQHARAFIIIMTFASSLTAGSQSITGNGAGRIAGMPDAGISSGIYSLPFMETWDQGTFTNHNWELSSPDTNWVVNTTYGNPAPCADFYWQPLATNFSQSLTSDTIDATAWSCASIWLDFDLKVDSYNSTGNEKMDIEVSRDSTWHLCTEVANTASTEWVSYHVKLTGVMNQLFRIRFVVHGVNSAEVFHWYLDNIHVYGSCNSPWRFDTGSMPGHMVYLCWLPPDCSKSSATQFIFDDGFWENGFRCNPGALGWYGNEFPVGNVYGILQRISLYFLDNLPGGSPEPMSIDIFDSTRMLIYSTPGFLPSLYAWCDVPIPDIPFGGNFYAMVKYNNLTADPYYLACDETGPEDYAWSINSVGVWKRVSDSATFPCVFLCRASAVVYNDMSVAADSSILIGYNVYRSMDGGSPPFSKRNLSPVNGLNYTDTLPPNTPPWTNRYDYFVTSVLMNLSDSTILCEGSTDTIEHIWLGMDKNEINGARVWPNPATGLIYVENLYPDTQVEVISMTGTVVYEGDLPDENTAQIDVSGFPPGVYFVRMTNRRTVSVGKFLKR